jgi:DNA-binding transcriptional ArsR family regulator
MSNWRFVTNHWNVLTQVAKHPQITMRQIAAHLGITERSVHRIISDLETEGYLTRVRSGRVNYYTVNPDLPLSRPELQDVLVGGLLLHLFSHHPMQEGRTLVFPSDRGSGRGGAGEGG